MWCELTVNQVATLFQHEGCGKGTLYHHIYSSFCVEGLPALLHKAIQNRALKGVAASARGPTISHLFFVDDSLIFGRATVKEGEEIQRVLKVYEESFG